MADLWEPFVSVILPIRNEKDFIARCLGAVLAQDYPAQRMEIIVADGLSDDGTLEMIQLLPEADRVRVIPNPSIIQAAGLNAAIQQAQGDIIVRVDGHTIIASDYVRQCVAAIHRTGASNVGGAMDPIGVTWMGRAIAAAGKSPFAVPTAFHVSQKPQFTDTVYLGAWPHETFQKVGLYNEQVGVNEDYELNYRIRAAGGRIYFTPLIRSTYYGRQTLWALAKQYYRYGRSKIRTLRQHPRSMKLRHLVAPAFVAVISLGSILAVALPLIGYVWLAFVGVYLAANLAASTLTAVQRGLLLFPLLPVVFLTIHLAWGIGFWIELLVPHQ